MFPALSLTEVQSNAAEFQSGKSKDLGAQKYDLKSVRRPGNWNAAAGRTPKLAREEKAKTSTAALQLSGRPSQRGFPADDVAVIMGGCS